MNMGKNIIAIRVSDLHEILNGCDWIGEPGYSKEMSLMIIYAML